MTARPLGACPTCRRSLDEHVRAAMGLRNGELLNSLCPGYNGPSDIDHVLHNGKSTPERIVFYEYKDGAPLTTGQAWLLRSLRGDWHDRAGRSLSIQTLVLPQRAAVTSEAVERLKQSVAWLWPGYSAPPLNAPSVARQLQRSQ